MKIGIMADSHDHLPNLRKALEIFQKEQCEKFLHCGDYCSPFVIKAFKEFGIPFLGVFGNNDGELIFLSQMAQGIGEIKKGPIEIELAGRKIALMHEPAYISALRSSKQFDLILYGHLHQALLDPTPPVLINPGECCGYLSGKAMVAVCDLRDLAAKLVEL